MQQVFVPAMLSCDFQTFFPSTPSSIRPRHKSICAMHSAPCWWYDWYLSDASAHVPPSAAVSDFPGPVPQDTYYQARSETMKNIESTVVELGAIFQQLAHMVHEQEEMVQR